MVQCLSHAAVLGAQHTDFPLVIMHSRFLPGYAGWQYSAMPRPIMCLEP